MSSSLPRRGRISPAVRRGPSGPLLPPALDRAAQLADRIWFSRGGAALRTAATEAVGLASPVWCIGCGEEDTDLCTVCAADLRRMTRRPFRAEDSADALPVLPDDCSEAGFSVMPVCAAGRYQGILARAVPAFKDREFVGLDRVLAPALARATAEALHRLPSPKARQVILVPAPASSGSRLRRGFDPLERLMERAGLADRAVRALSPVHRPLEVWGPLLSAGSAGTQKSRGARARRSSLAGTLCAAPPGPTAGAEVLLVDDVLTTGATVAEMHRALTVAGHRVCGAVVLAAAWKARSSAFTHDFPPGGDAGTVSS